MRAGPVWPALLSLTTVQRGPDTQTPLICAIESARGIDPPIDSVYPRLDDETGLRAQAEFARSLGFFVKSAIHPRQLAVLHEVFTPSAEELEWAQTVVDTFARTRGEAVKLPDGEFVDLPLAQRAQRLLELAHG